MTGPRHWQQENAVAWTLKAFVHRLLARRGLMLVDVGMVRRHEARLEQIAQLRRELETARVMLKADQVIRSSIQILSRDEHARQNGPFD